MKRIYGLIRKLGANSKYKGYFFTAEAIRMTMAYQEKPLRITKDIYPNLAKKYKSTPTNSEFIDMLAYYLLEMEESESA